MTIQQLLDMPIGEKTGGGFLMTIKHTHKLDKYTVEKGVGTDWIPDYGYVHEVTLTDSTGDMLADMWMLKRNPLVRRREVKIIVCQIQPAAKGKKLLVHEWENITCTADELPQRDPLGQNSPNWDAISRGKTKCRLTEAILSTGTDVNSKWRKKIAKLADWVMSPEDKYDG